MHGNAHQVFHQPGDMMARKAVITVTPLRQTNNHLVAERLGISDRHCRRLLQRYCTDGPLGMADRRRGKPSNYKLPAGLDEHAIQIIRERYSDFGPTLACEKLAELHGVTLSKETVRKLMMQSGLWIPHRHRASKIQQPRYRRACVGELIQIDATALKSSLIGLWRSRQLVSRGKKWDFPGTGVKILSRPVPLIHPARAPDRICPKADKPALPLYNHQT